MLTESEYNDRRHGSGRLKSITMTNNIVVVQDLDDAPHTHTLFYVAPPIVVHFNCAQFAAWEYLL